jgi:acetyl esterase/lipase
MESEGAYKMFAEASAITHLTKDDAPVFLYYNVANTPVTPETAGGDRIHHPAFGVYLKERMEKAGVECVLHLREEYADQNPAAAMNRDLVQFFVKHFPKEWARAQQPERRVHVYKVVGDCEIKADVYAQGTTGKKPVVVWIHGGALIMGSRAGVPAFLLALARSSGCAVVSIDYRLAPETKLPAIIEDLQDAFRWVRTKGPEIFGADPNRIAVAGGSAGGYLTLMSGFCVDPSPKALVSFYGYGDIAGPWYSRPDPFYAKLPEVPKDEAYSAVGTKALTSPSPGNKRGRFYLYCRQRGLWPKEVTGHDPDLDNGWFDRYCPIRNVSKSYPPTLLIHGTSDTDVPYDLSKTMAAKLDEIGVEHELLTVPGAGHGLTGIPPAEVRRINDRAAGFLKAHWD